MRFNKIEIKKYVGLLFFLVPFFILYNIIFFVSMESAHDRVNYLYIMANPFQSREEPLLHIFSALFSFFISSPDIKLIFIQNIFIFSLFFSISFYLINNKKPLLYVGVVFVLAILFFSNYFSTQLRLGYAISILFFLVLFFFEKSNGRFNILLIFFPLLMHFGVFFFSLFYFIFNILKIDNLKKFLIFIILSIVVLTILNSHINDIFGFLGVSQYYVSYLDSSSDINDGRFVPYTLIAYLVLCIFFIYRIVYKKIYNTSYFFALSGLFLVYWGVVLGFYIAFKFLAPIGMYALILAAKEISFKYDVNNFIFFYIVLYLVLIFFVGYFSYQVGFDLLEMM